MIHKPLQLCILLLTTLVFSPLSVADTLEDAVNTAIKLNPEVRTAIDRRWEAEQQLKQQKAGYLPSVDLAGGEGTQNTVSPNSSFDTDSNGVTLERSESSLTLTENLFKGFGTKNDVKRSTYNVESAAYKTSGVAEDIALQASEQYLEVLRHQEFVVLAQRNLGILKNISEMIKMRTEAGIAKRADYDQAQGRLALANNDLVAQQRDLNDANFLYQRVIGVTPRTLRSPNPPTLSQLPATEEHAVQQAINNNPNLRAANADIIAAYAQHASSKSANYPEINLVLNGRRDYNLDGQPGANDSNEAMVRGSWNLYKGGADIAKQRETAYQAQEAIDTRNRTIWEIQKNVQVSWNAWKEAERSLQYLKAHRDFSLSTFHSYQLQYKIGQRTLLDVLDAQNEYYRASLDYITGKYTEIFARYRILNTMGSLLSYLRVSAPIEADVKMPKGYVLHPQKESPPSPTPPQPVMSYRTQ